MDIEGLGEVVADKLIERGLIREPLDLFELKLEQLAKLNLGRKKHRELRREERDQGDARNRARKNFFALRWLFALGIREVGKTTASQLAAFHADLESIAHSPLLRDVVDYHRALREKRRDDLDKIKTRLIESGFAEKSKGEKQTGIVTEVGPVVARPCSISSRRMPGKRR